MVIDKELNHPINSREAYAFSKLAGLYCISEHVPSVSKILSMFGLAFKEIDRFCGVKRCLPAGIEGKIYEAMKKYHMLLKINRDEEIAEVRKGIRDCAYMIADIAEERGIKLKRALIREEADQLVNGLISDQNFETLFTKIDMCGNGQTVEVIKRRLKELQYEYHMRVDEIGGAKDYYMEYGM